MDGHDAGDDGAVDAGLVALVDEAQEDLRIVDQLSDDKIGAGVDLGFEMGQLAGAVNRGRVAFGVAGDADAKVVAVGFADMAHQIDGVG